jgi:non-heme Fe2+,alpha-ketoglutarate-dependent halogenase
MISQDFVYDDTAKAHYQEDGYHIFDNCLTPQGVDTCRSNIERIVASLHADSIPEEIICVHQRGERWLWDLAVQPQILDMIERTIGPDILLWSIHILAKRPGAGIDVPWHQDAPYWNVSGNMPGAVWLAIDDVDEGNGSMSVLPGWHTKGTLPRRDSRANNAFNEEIEPGALPENIDDIKVTYRLKGGQMATHHTMIPHSSTTNRSERWRRVIVLRYIAADAQIGEKTYVCPITREPFDREAFLVRGRDLNDQGRRQTPF